MPLDHSKALVRIYFEGISLLSVNDSRECEVGIVKCSDHELNITIRKHTPHGSTNIDHKLDLERDIKIEVINPVERYVQKYTPARFRRLTDTGDREDFRWVSDLEGSELHKHKLNPNKDRGRRKPDKLKLRLFITDGMLYTERKSEKLFARVRWDRKRVPTYFGRVAERVGVDIVCKDGADSAVVLKNLGSSPGGVKLPKESNTWYEIVVKTSCEYSIGQEAEGSDFRRYYDLISDPDGKKYDLQLIERLGCTRSFILLLARFLHLDHWIIIVDGYPRVCNAGSLSITKSLVLPELTT